MRHYFDVNVLYNLSKIPQDIIVQSYTSAFSILEIIAGINDKQYNRRRACLENIKRCNLTVDWRLPISIYHDSFNVLNEFDIIDGNVSALKELMNDCLSADTYNDIQRKDLLERFTKIDLQLSFGFTAARKGINEIFQEKNNPIIFNEVEFKFDKQPLLNAIFYSNINYHKETCLIRIVDTVYNTIQKSTATDKPVFSKDQIFQSYNSSIDVFLEAFNVDFSNAIGVNELPNKNHSQDLYHILYMKPNVKIVSEDKIFKKLLPEQCITLQELIHF